MERSETPTFLVADIGGTNTRVALSEGTTLRPETVRRFKNADYDGFEPVLENYVAESSATAIAGACVAVAGPVRDGKAELTNRNWSIDAGTVSRPTHAPMVSVINDLEAQGYALGLIPEDHLRGVLTGRPAKDVSDKLVIGVGTGFNCAPVHDGDGGRYVAASESGHASLPIGTEADLGLWKFIEARHGFASVEEVLSGRGLETVYAWHAHESGTMARLAAADIMASLKTGSDDLARKTVQTFVRMLGIVAGDLALIALPFGGVFFAGGVARAVAPYFAEFGFKEAFTGKGRFSELASGFPVSVIEDDYAALLGCSACLDAKISANPA